MGVIGQLNEQLTLTCIGGKFESFVFQIRYRGINSEFKVWKLNQSFIFPINAQYKHFKTLKFLH